LRIDTDNADIIAAAGAAQGRYFLALRRVASQWAGSAPGNNEPIDVNGWLCKKAQ